MDGGVAAESHRFATAAAAFAGFEIVVVVVVVVAGAVVGAAVAGLFVASLEWHRAAAAAVGQSG